MSRIGRSWIMLCVGAFALRLVWGGGFGAFVQQRMQWPLGAAAVALIVFGVSEMMSTPGRGEKRSVAPRVGWLLILPLVVLVGVAPTALGSSAVDRVDNYVPPEASTDLFPPLDDSDGPVESTLVGFIDRAVYDDEGSLDGVDVRLTGFVVNDPSVPGGFRLTRFVVGCCAADGVPVQVDVHGVDQPYADDTWVSVDVRWRRPATPYLDQGADWTVAADALAISELDAEPDDPYESPG